MRGFVIGLVLLAAGSLPAQRRRVGQASGLSLPEEAVTEGRRVYNQTCTACHGIDGQVGDRGPALAGNRRYLRSTDQELFEAIRDGIPGTLMPPAGLPEEATRKVVV